MVMVKLHKEVVVHPLVLLSVVDHYNRVAQNTSKRVVGILLGEVYQGRVDVTNSYAVPFEEDKSDPSIWYLDHNYHEDMYTMFSKVNAKEKVVGWYSTGPKIRAADIQVNELIKNYCNEPAFVIIDVNPTDDITIPTEAYQSVENSDEELLQNQRTFVHVPSSVGAFEAEEVGVEHLLRDIHDGTVSTLQSKINSKVTSLKGLEKQLKELVAYVENVVSGEMPWNHQVMYNLQDIFNLSPNLRIESVVKGFAGKTNDTMFICYMSSMIRCVLALHNLINNKLANKDIDAVKRELRKKPDSVTA